MTPPSRSERRWTLYVRRDGSVTDILCRQFGDEEIDVVPAAEVERLQRLLWECHCNASDGVPVPFGRWLMDGGPEAMPADVEELRDAYDTHTERMDAAEAENTRLRTVLLAVRTEAYVDGSGGWVLRDGTFERVRGAIEEDADAA